MAGTSWRVGWTTWGLLVLCVIPVLAGIVRLTGLATGHATAEDARFFTAPMPVVLHIVSVTPYSLLGAFQFARGLRNAHPGWHRAAGRVLAVLGLATAGSGLWMTLTYAWPAGDGLALYITRLIVGSVMAFAIVAGVVAIRRGKVQQHRAWMTRAYALGMGAGTQVLTHVPWFLLYGKPDEPTRAVLMAAGWIINLLVAEAVIRWWREPKRIAAEAL